MGQKPMDDYTGWIVGGAGSLIFLAFLLKKLFSNWKASDTEDSLLSMLHKEVLRMGTQNSTLMTELQGLQREVIILNNELLTLTKENKKLHEQVTLLSSEVNRLQQLLPGRL